MDGADAAGQCGAIAKTTEHFASGGVSARVGLLGLFGQSRSQNQQELGYKIVRLLLSGSLFILLPAYSNSIAKANPEDKVTLTMTHVCL